MSFLRRLFGRGGGTAANNDVWQTTQQNNQISPNENNAHTTDGQHQSGGDSVGDAVSDAGGGDSGGGDSGGSSCGGGCGGGGGD